jgi:hypothetical protein
VIVNTVQPVLDRANQLLLEAVSGEPVLAVPSEIQSLVDDWQQPELLTEQELQQARDYGENIGGRTKDSEAVGRFIEVCTIAMTAVDVLLSRGHINHSLDTETEAQLTTKLALLTAVRTKLVEDILSNW